MSSTDWYTRETWNQEFAVEFWQKISRKRDPRMKAQLIRIQAAHLEKANLIDDALSLLDVILNEYPESFDISQVYHQLGECYVKKDKIEDAIDALKKSIAIENEKPNYQTGSWLTFAVLITEHKLTKYYPDFTALIERMTTRPGGIEARTRFPLEQYYFYGTLSNIEKHNGNIENSKKYAELALAASEKTESGFRYHPKLGLVQEKNTPFHSSLVAEPKKQLTSQLISLLWRRTR